MNRLKLSKHVLVTVLLLFSLEAIAVKPVYSGGRERAAIRGYDAVAYFTENQPVKGSKEFVVEHLGARWMFASAENRQRFLDNPDKYMPQYGGYCAYAIAQNTTASSKPEYFTIVDDKLYLNYSKSVYRKWLKEKEDYIVDADENWPTLKD